MSRRYTPPSDRAQALEAKAFGAFFELAPRAAEPFEIVGRFAVVSICGPLVQHGPSWWDNYDAIEERVKAAIASPCEAVILRIDSPGGDATGVFDLARAIRAAAGPKEIIAYTDNMCASAAYAIACAADSIVVASTGIVGSVGVFQAIVETTAQDRAMGVNYQLIASGARKGDGNPHIAITDGAMARVQSDVDQLAALFFGTVTELRGMTTEALVSLQGATRIGARAVADGLANRIATWAELTRDVAAASATPEDKMDKEELKKALKAAAEKDDAPWAKRALKAMDDESEDGDKKKDDDAKAAAAKAEFEKEEKKKDDDDAKALAAGSSAQASAFELTKRIHALESERAQERTEKARAELLSKRPDFSEQVRKSLAASPLSLVEDAVKNWPMVPGAGHVPPSAEGGRASGTVGKGQSRAASSVDADDDYIARKMGQSVKNDGIKHLRDGRVLELGMMSQEEAKAFIAAKKAQA
jgi:ClpP class serine protease